MLVFHSSVSLPHCSHWDVDYKVNLFELCSLMCVLNQESTNPWVWTKLVVMHGDTR